MNKISVSFFFMCVMGFAVHASAQGEMSKTLTAQDYARAEQLLSYNTAPLIDGGSVSPHWLPNGKFWYKTFTAEASQFIMVTPSSKTRTAAFDHQKLAASLSSAAGKRYEANHLPFSSISFSEDGKTMSFTADRKKWTADLATYTITEQAQTNNAASQSKLGDVFSPDGSKAVFIKDYNLWMRDVGTGKTTQLTTDGEQDFGYATDNAGWTHSDNPIVRWSPDS